MKYLTYKNLSVLLFFLLILLMTYDILCFFERRKPIEVQIDCEQAYEICSASTRHYYFAKSR